MFSEKNILIPIAKIVSNMKYQSESLQTELPYQVIAYYWLEGIDAPHQLIKDHKDWFSSRDASARIYINEQGINAQMCIATDQALDYMNWIQEKIEKKLFFKIQGHDCQAFPRCNVRYRKKLVAIDEDVDCKKGGEHLTPLQWQQMLEQEQNKILIDVRNDYEWKVGHFAGAELPKCKTFREFSDYADQLKEKVNPENTKVMMYCTGGIRCELYSAVLKERGFDSVYQLDGGIINYGAEQDGKHWKGKLFVFDDRLTVPVGTDNKEVIGKCLHCNAPTEKMYNCANTECNELFLSCSSCLKKMVGCCKESCTTSEKLRPYQDGVHKPFRRIAKSGIASCQKR